MSKSMLIKGDGGYVQLDILGYENAGATDLDDANWLRAKLEAAGGPFSGSVAMALTSRELSRLHKLFVTVTDALSGEIRFESMEGNWVLNLDFERTGTAVVNGKVSSDLSSGNYLHYEFRMDGITLEAATRHLGSMCIEFPIKS